MRNSNWDLRTIARLIKPKLIWAYLVVGAISSCSTINTIDLENKTVVGIYYEVHQQPDERKSNEVIGVTPPMYAGLQVVEGIIIGSTSARQLDVNSVSQYHAVTDWNIELEQCSSDYPYEVNSNNQIVRLFLSRLGMFGSSAYFKSNAEWAKAIREDPPDFEKNLLCDPVDSEMSYDTTSYYEEWQADVQECWRDRECSMFMSFGFLALDKRYLEYEYINDASFLPLLLVEQALIESLAAEPKKAVENYFPTVVYKTELLFAKTEIGGDAIYLSAPLIRGIYIRSIKIYVTKLENLWQAYVNSDAVRGCYPDCQYAEIEAQMYELERSINALALEAEKHYVAATSFLIGHELAHVYGPRMLTVDTFGEHHADCLSLGGIQMARKGEGHRVFGDPDDFVFTEMMSDIFGGKNAFWVSNGMSIDEIEYARRKDVVQQYLNYPFEDWEEIYELCSGV